jgi:MFS family permease
VSTLSKSVTGGTDASHEGLYRRLNWRLLPILLTCYFFACLDRQNISFAKLQMQNDLAFSDAIYGLGAGIFFIGYALFEVPSNLLLPKLGARRTISRILVLWGITSAAMMFVRDVTTFYCLRFLLGVFEAGFAPGMIFYLTYWYGQNRMARALAIVLMAGPISGVLGGPLSASVMTMFDGAWGMSGWQWMFLIEGLPCALLGGIVWFVLADRPETARWLSDEEKATIRVLAGVPEHKHKNFRSIAKDPRVYHMAGAYFCLICGIYTVNFWLPSILKANGVRDTMQIGLFTTIPYIASVFGMAIAGRSSDKLRERRWHSALPALVSGICLAIATAYSGILSVSLVFMTIATLAMYGAYTVFWAIPSQHLKGDGAAGGIALINTIGLIGGFVSPTMIGWAAGLTGSLNAGLYVMVVLLIIGFILLAMLKNDSSGTGHLSD